MMAINQICSERNLPQEIIYEAIESALVSAYKRNFSSGQNIKASIDIKTGQPQVFAECIVVERVEDDRFEISLAEARKIDTSAELGSLIKKDVTPKSFGRIAAQTAKQVILQRIREAERDALFSSYVDREGELINGMVANITSHAVTLNLGRTEAIMPRSQQVPGERYRVGQRVRAYVMEVRRSSRGPQIVVSRTHRNMLRRLLELEVPEIFNGTVEIKAIAREAGSRSKVAVAALQDGVDPVGSCVGIRGMRIQSIVNELGGEKIDVVEWNADMSKFIANALSPAKVNYALLGAAGSDGKTATVVVPDDQLSLAIGKEGQNARLAAKLTGWRIDIKSISEAATEDLTADRAAAPAGKERDILAMAEAILLGKEPAPAKMAEEAEQELVSELELIDEVEEEAPEPETDAVLAKAEALLREQAPLEELELQAQGSVEPSFEGEAVEGEPLAAEVEWVETELLAEPETVDREQVLAAEELLEPELKGAALEEEMAETAEEEAPEPVVILNVERREKPKARSKVKSIKYEYVKDEELESLKKPKSRRSRRANLVLDEDTGKLVSRRKHRRNDDLDEFEWKG
jgi:N utilization substance protein A